MGFDIDMGIEMAKAPGVKAVFVDTRWTSIIPALELGRIDIIFGGMSVTEGRKQRVDFAEPFMTVGQTVRLNAKHRTLILLLLHFLYLFVIEGNDFPAVEHADKDAVVVVRYHRQAVDIFFCKFLQH